MLDKTYSPVEIEQKHYSAAERSGAFAAAPESMREPYCIMMPPPNVTGNLHMGHALTFTIQDILIRYHRRIGDDTLWMPGTDHAGIATQMVVERQLADAGINRRDLGREKFLEKVWSWKEQSGGAITSQLRRLGATPDWQRERFTMDDGLSFAVRKVFVELFRQGLIYRDKRLVNWDPKLQTAISDLEVEQRPVKGKMWHFRYPLENDPTQFLCIATTRPETMLGDGAVAVNPDDERYKHLIGQYVILPLANRRIPVIADAYADPEKGSGAVKITAAHDFNDFKVWERHRHHDYFKLQLNGGLINLFDERARMSDHVPEAYRGLDRFEARKKIIDDLTALDLVDKIEDNPMTIPHGDRSGVVIEPFLTDQWYCDAATLAKPAIDAVRSGKIKFVPQKWENTYYAWLENIQPWCISRQLWWGHQIPAWYGPDGHVFVGMDEADAEQQARNHYQKSTKLTRDGDVLDTWFSSALWPFSTLGWENGEDSKTDWTKFKRYYPTDVLVTGFDIIFFWVARMIMMGMHFMGDVPFREVYIHALVRDASGQKMSKSKGNVIDPLSVIDEYGCDALRFTLAALSVPGRDIKMSSDRVNGYRSFATKLWNAARFTEMNGCNYDPTFDPAQCAETINRWIIGEVVACEQKLSEAIADYRFDEAAETIYHTVWGSFCDWYLEFTKPILSGDNLSAVAETKKCTAWVLAQLVHMLNPIMPFITEELAEKLQLNGGKMLVNAPWPKYSPSMRDAESADEVSWLIEVISSLRSARSDLKIPFAEKLPLLIETTSNNVQKYLQKYREVILKIAGIKNIKLSAGDENISMQYIDIPHIGYSLKLVVDNIVDLSAERARLQKEIDKLQDELQKLDAKLNNPKFIQNAAEDAIDEVREKHADARGILHKVQSAFARIKGNETIGKISTAV